MTQSFFFPLYYSLRLCFWGPRLQGDNIPTRRAVLYFLSRKRKQSERHISREHDMITFLKKDYCCYCYCNCFEIILLSGVCSVKRTLDWESKFSFLASTLLNDFKKMTTLSRSQFLNLKRWKDLAGWSVSIYVLWIYIEVPRQLFGNNYSMSGNRLHFVASAFMVCSNLGMSVDSQILNTIFWSLYYFFS